MDYRQFKGTVDVRLLNEYEQGRRRVMFLEPIGYWDTQRNIAHIIPVGTITDWTSAPRWAWWLIPAFDQAAEAAALHDSLLKLRQVLQNGIGVEIPRSQIDRIYREALRPLGVPQWRRNLHWVGVRFNAWYRGDRG